MPIMRRSILCGLFLAGLGRTAHAQTFPDHGIRMLVGFSPGGGVDLIARIFADKLSARFHQPVVVENRTGASGNIAAAAVAHAPADGYTLLMVPIAHVVNPAVLKNIPFDPLHDFAPISQIASAPNVLMVNAQLGVATLADFIALARREPGRIAYASSGVGTSTHLAMELFRQMAGIQLQHVPYRGGGAALSALLSGEVSAYFASIPAATGYMSSPQLKALAVTGTARSPSLPNVPTVQEAGVPGYVYTGWYGLLAPAGPPPEVVAALHDGVVAALKTPEVLARLKEDGSDPVGSTPAAFGAFLASELARWKHVMVAAGAKAG